jgi:DNA-binding HxlR family transcriptional regulator
MTIEERDAWLDEVVQSRASGGQFKVAWLIANAILRDGNRVRLMELERQIGTIHRRSVQRALQWLEWRGLLRIERPAVACEPNTYTLLSRKHEKEAA